MLRSVRPPRGGGRPISPYGLSAAMPTPGRRQLLHERPLRGERRQLRQSAGHRGCHRAHGRRRMQRHERRQHHLHPGQQLTLHRRRDHHHAPERLRSRRQRRSPQRQDVVCAKPRSGSSGEIYNLECGKRRQADFGDEEGSGSPAPFSCLLTASLSGCTVLSPSPQVLNQQRWCDRVALVAEEGLEPPTHGL